MLINRPKPETGICFAWTPKWTPDGTVWLEWVHYRRIDDAYDIHPWRYWRIQHVTDEWGHRRIDYARWVPQDRYDAGERAQTKYFDYAMVNGRVVPPSVSKCAERNSNDPCRYPRCTCMDVGGSRCPT